MVVFASMPSSLPAPLRARVIGAGPTGALAALALAEAGWTVELADSLSAADLQRRQRAYALTHSSRQLLERLQLWAHLEPLLVPFRQLRLLDAALARSVDFSSADLASAPTAAAPVGWIVRHGPLMALLLDRLARHPAVTLQLGAGPSEAESSGWDLVVAADGPNSSTRGALGIGCWGWTYRQSCLTAEVDLRGAGFATAWEVLRPEGPFAVLPLGDGHFQLVWSAPQASNSRREALEPAAFLDGLAAVLPDGLEPDALLDRPRAFPAGLQLAHRLSRGSTVLVGESAHRCHPVGGQGLNLCWRDVAVLHRLALRVAAGSLPAHRLGAAYGRRRWPDLLLILLSTDALVRLFSSRHPLLLGLRRPVLAALAAMPALRQVLLAVMTDGRPRLRPRPAVASLAPW